MPSQEHDERRRLAGAPVDPNYDDEDESFRYGTRDAGARVSIQTATRGDAGRSPPARQPH